MEKYGENEPFCNFPGRASSHLTLIDYHMFCTCLNYGVFIYLTKCDQGLTFGVFYLVKT